MIPEIPDRQATIDIQCLDDTEALGRCLGKLLFTRAVVALVGPLGAGKTHLVRAIAEGLGIRNRHAVSSPTFVLIQEYPARLPIYHFDAYRLKGAEDFLDLGVNEYYEMDGVCLIEWADRVEQALPDEHLRIEITPVDQSKRRMVLTARGERHVELLRQVTAFYPDSP